MELSKRIENALRIAESIKKGKIDSKNLYDLLLHLSEAKKEIESKTPTPVIELLVDTMFRKAIHYGYLYSDDFGLKGYENYIKTMTKFFIRNREELDKIGWNSKRFIGTIVGICNHCGGDVEEDPWDLCKGCSEVLP